MSTHLPQLPSRHGLRPRVVLSAVFLVLLLASLATGCSLALRRESLPVVPPGVAGQVMRSTVDVQVRGVASGWTVHQGLGTGVVFNRDGVIVTNDHVIDLNGEPRDSITIRTVDGRSAEARVLGRFPDLDLAFLKVDLEKLRPARFITRLDQVRTGDQVVAIGAPNYFTKPLARGRVLHVLENVRVQRVPGLRALVESSARLRRGFSGGPLVNAQGRIVAVNMATAPGPGSRPPTSLAIPAPIVLEAAAELGLSPSGG